MELTGSDAVHAAERQGGLAVADFGIEELREFLRRHETFCAENHVSASVRYGLRWLVYTARRTSDATVLSWDDIRDDVDGLPDGWWAAVWRGDLMKNDVPHVLPLPPRVVQMLIELRGATGLGTGRAAWSTWNENERAGRDETTLVQPREGNPLPVGAAWRHMFPVRRGNAPGDSALRQHLRRMRGWRTVEGRKVRDGPDLLADLPPFTLHAIRSTAATFLDDDPTLPEGVGSLVLGHVSASLRRDAEDAVQVTSRHDSRAHRVANKVPAMKAWIAALTEDSGSTTSC